jgi:hypothetical protein
VVCRRVSTAKNSATESKPNEIDSHTHDIPIVKAHSDRPRVVDVLTGQDLGSIGNDITNGRCDKRSASSECHLSRVACTRRSRIRAIVHDIYNVAYHSGSLSLTLPPFSIVGYDLVECAVLYATRYVEFVLLGCVEDLESGRKEGRRING